MSNDPDITPLMLPQTDLTKNNTAGITNCTIAMIILNTFVTACMIRLPFLSRGFGEWTVAL